MGITAVSGPQLSYGITQTSSGAVTEYNEERAPSVYDLGSGLMDPRTPYKYYPGSPVGTKVYSFWDNKGVVDQVPTTLSTNSIAQAQAPVSGTALTLTASNSGAVTVGITMSNPPEGGAAVTNLLAIDSTSALPTLTWGSGATMATWDPTKAISRCVTITVTGTSVNVNDGGMNWTIAGRDLYGYKMTEQIAGSTQTSSVPFTYTSKKAFKYISAVTPLNSTGTLKSTSVIVGVSDTYGYPLRVDHPAYADVYFGVSTGVTVAAVSSQTTFASTATATSTTGDVRGTFASTGFVSNSSLKLVMVVYPSVQNVNSVSASDVSGIFGVAQYSSV